MRVRLYTASSPDVFLHIPAGQSRLGLCTWTSYQRHRHRVPRHHARSVPGRARVRGARHGSGRRPDRLPVRGRCPSPNPACRTSSRATSRPDAFASPRTCRRAAGFGDVHFICVGTPQSASGMDADVSAVHTVAPALAEHVGRDCLIVGKSTVPVGTTASLAERGPGPAPARRERDHRLEPGVPAGRARRRGHPATRTSRLRCLEPGGGAHAPPRSTRHRSTPGCPSTSPTRARRSSPRSRPTPSSP